LHRGRRRCATRAQYSEEEEEEEEEERGLGKRAGLHATAISSAFLSIHCPFHLIYVVGAIPVDCHDLKVKLKTQI
jgi:hypothetical protein